VALPQADSDAIGHIEAAVIDVSDIQRATTFWAAVVGVDFGASFEPTFRRAHLPSGLDLVLQQVAERKSSAKNRVHLDVLVDDLDLALARVQTIGGTYVDRVRNEHGGHIICADPDGNEFCLTTA
jgi:predicted enzyme related to lactoylglutathione lyase